MGSSTGQPNHGRHQEQHDGDEEDDLGDFDGRSGDAAKAQYACDQGDDQNVTTQLSMTRPLFSIWFRYSMRRRTKHLAARIGCQNNRGPEQKFRLNGVQECAKKG